MTLKIKILDQHSANQIAAGEVVERPVSVVKELVENSLDAGAKNIEIAVEGNGVPLIRVRDNGEGISADDLPLAVLRHATSKISKIEDLENLRTLGFRGEALPSIASVAKMEISSRPPGEVSGMYLKIEGGQQTDLRVTGCPVGTTVTVQDLFFNTPARRKFLKSTNTEFGLISDIVGRLAMARPDVAFSLTHPKQIVFQTPGRGNLLESIGAVLGNDIARRLIPISVVRNDWSIEGYISPPDLVRSTRQGETFIVNGRIIRSSLLSRALGDAYHTLIPNKLHPIAVLHFRIPPNEYDVNVHPTKMEIRFHQEKELAQFITEELHKALLNSKPVSTFDKTTSSQTIPFNTPSPNQLSSLPRNIVLPHEIPNKTLSNTAALLEPNELFIKQGNNSIELKLFETSNEESNEESNEDLKRLSETEQSKQDIPAGLIEKSKQLDDPKPAYFPLYLSENTYSKDTCTVGSVKVPEELVLANPLLDLRPLAQVFNTYILATDGQHLVIIDQHAAHERINYEKLLAEYKRNPAASQALLLPLPVELTPQEEQVLLEYFMQLTEMGFVLEHFGPRTYLMRGIPAYAGPWQGEDLLRRFLDLILQKNTLPTFSDLVEEWIYMLACKESIKAQENLSLLEMQQLLIQLSKTENPYSCPHGRPTMIKLTRAEIEKRFYRT